MTKPRKKWEPVHRFGGAPAEWSVPNPIGERMTNPMKAQLKKGKKRK